MMILIVNLDLRGPVLFRSGKEALAKDTSWQWLCLGSTALEEPSVAVQGRPRKRKSG